MLIKCDYPHELYHCDPYSQFVSHIVHNLCQCPLYFQTNAFS